VVRVYACVLGAIPEPAGRREMMIRRASLNRGCCGRASNPEVWASGPQVLNPGALRPKTRSTLSRDGSRDSVRAILSLTFHSSS